MPRAFDSDEPPAQLSFTENVTCKHCNEVFEGTFYDYTQSQSVEDMTEAPAGWHQCPACRFSWVSEMTGWMFYTEAG